MFYREIIAVCSQTHTKHINTLCGQNVELLNVKLAVYIVTIGAFRFKCLLLEWADDSSLHALFTSAPISDYLPAEAFIFTDCTILL